MVSFIKSTVAKKGIVMKMRMISKKIVKYGLQGSWIADWFIFIGRISNRKIPVATAVGTRRAFSPHSTFGAGFNALGFPGEWLFACIYYRKRAIPGGITLLIKPHPALRSLPSVALSSVWVKAGLWYLVFLLNFNTLSALFSARVALFSRDDCMFSPSWPHCFSAQGAWKKRYIHSSNIVIHLRCVRVFFTVEVFVYSQSLIVIL